jgi:hypothetical protein
MLVPDRNGNPVSNLKPPVVEAVKQAFVTKPAPIKPVASKNK